ncbi:MAG: polysaccharide deacetylase [Parcubacteria group bacterium]|nr:polysaccharide deacetylase [Parcubacteria group bacterium]
MKRSRSHKKALYGVLFVLALLLIAVAVRAYVTTYNSEREDEDDLYAESYEAAGFAGAEAAYQGLPEASPVAGSVKVPIIIYHSVRPYIPNEDALQDAYDVTPELLESELAYLKNNGYTAISLDQLELLASGATTTPSKPVVLTFDDGWRNQYKYAFPLLKKYGDTATFYIYTNPIVHNLPHYLTWDMVREMDASGMTIASHTLTHPYLSKLTPEELRKEIQGSKILIEENLGKPVKHFASPFGYTNAEIQGIVKDAGYETARTTYKGIYHSKDDLLKLTGILAGDSLSGFVKSLGN